MNHGALSPELNNSDILALSGMNRSHVAELAHIIARPTDIGRRSILTPFMRTLLVLVALRTNLTERALAAIFGVSQPTAHRVIAQLLPRLADLFVPSIGDEPLLLDGTMIPVHDQSRTACSRNYRRSINTQIIATFDGRIAHIGDAWPGNRHDIIVARATIPSGPTYIADGAYRSFPGAITPPPTSEPTARAAHIKLRTRVEHVIARLKDWQILRQCRRRGCGIDHALRAVAYLNNVRFGHI